MRVTPDDEVYRVNAVWLGPPGFTFPWTGRYLAYAVGLAIFALVIGVEAVTPLTVGAPPVWEFSLSVFATYVVMGFVDHERSVGSVVQTLSADLNAPRPETRHLSVRVRASFAVRGRAPRAAGPRRGTAATAVAVAPAPGQVGSHDQASRPRSQETR